MSSGEVPVVRSVVAVGAGFFAVMVLSAAADVAFKGASFEVKLGYELLFVLAAGYVTARIAIRRPLFHALVMGALVLAGRALISAAAWDVTPAWFNVGILVLILPVALLGAKLGTWNRGSPSSP
jgi:hypothetical protein